MPAQEHLVLETQRNSLIDHLLDCSYMLSRLDGVELKGCLHLVSEDLPLRTYCPLLVNRHTQETHSQWLLKLKCGHHPAVLAALAAFASFSSSHPSILGNGELLPSSDILAIDYHVNAKVTCVNSKSLTLAGKRRAHICRDLYESARKLVWESGAMAVPSLENAIACYLLDSIETSKLDLYPCCAQSEQYS